MMWTKDKNETKSSQSWFENNIFAEDRVQMNRPIRKFRLKIKNSTKIVI